MDRSEATKTLRQINGRTQVAVDLTSVQTKFAQVDESIGDLSIDVANLAQDLADLQVLPNWVHPVQPDVALSNFGGCMPPSR